jgi:hypothetical protein
VSLADMNAGEPRVRESNSIPYISGGVAEEKEALERLSGQFNLKLTMSTAGGKFKPAPLQIEDSGGKKLIDMLDAGPIVLAKLPPGQYTVRLTPAESAPITRSVSVPSSGQAQLELVMPDRSASAE